MKRLFNLFRHDLDSEIEREVEFHIAERVDELVASGISEREAHYMARRQFGNRTGIEERTREMNIWLWLEEWLADLRISLRRLRKEPGFTLMALMSLALGIGANTAVYTLINDVMLKQLPVREPRQLVSWGNGDNAGVQAGLSGAIDLFSYDFAREMENNREMFAETASFGSFPLAVSARTSGTAQASRAMTELVSGSFFHLLGVNALLGRTIDTNDALSAGKNPVAVLSFHYWQRQYAGDRSVIGRPIIVNGTPFEIVGVAPEHFFGVSLDVDPDLFVPVTMQQQVMLQPSLLGPKGMFWLHMFSRMRPGTTMAQAREWTALQLRRDLVSRSGGTLSTDPMREIQASFVDLQPGGRGITMLRAKYWEPLQILMGVTGVVLLIACVNLASFSLARMASREKEIFARLALGAGRSRIVRQVLTEGLMLSLFGGVIGLMLASSAAKMLISFVVLSSDGTPLDATPDAGVLAFTLLASVGTGLLFSLIPALRASQVDIASRLRVSSRSVITESSRPGRFPLSRILVAAQVALSLVLLAGAALFVQTLRNLDRQGFGFNRQNALLVEFDARVAGYKPGKVRAYYKRLIQRAETIPGVRAVSLSTAQPVSGGSWRSLIFTGLGPGVLSRPVRPDEHIASSINAITPRYFEACGIPLLAGRTLEERDIDPSAKVTVVSQAFARHFFPNGDTLGQLVSIGGTPGQWRIVGIVGDGRYNSARNASPPMIYLPLWQVSDDDILVGSLQLRTGADAEQTLAQIRKAFAEVDPEVPISRADTFVNETDRFLTQERLISRLSSFFSIGALLLACIGLYGVMSHSVGRRSGEIGVRMALGAEGRDIRGMILKETFFMLAAGVLIGVPASMGAARAVQSQLYGVRPFDPMTLATATLLITVVMLAAGWLPAWRAARVDPMAALRDE